MNNMKYRMSINLVLITIMLFCATVVSSEMSTKLSDKNQEVRMSVYNTEIDGQPWRVKLTQKENNSTTLSLQICSKADVQKEPSWFLSEYKIILNDGRRIFWGSTLLPSRVIGKAAPYRTVKAGDEIQATVGIRPLGLSIEYAEKITLIFDIVDASGKRRTLKAELPENIVNQWKSVVKYR